MADPEPPVETLAWWCSARLSAKQPGDVWTGLTPTPLAGAGWSWVLLDTKVRRELAASAYGERVDETQRALQVVMAAGTGVASFGDLRPGHLDALPDAVLRRRLRHYLAENERVRACGCRHHRRGRCVSAAAPPR